MKHVRQDFPIFNKKVNGHPLIYFDHAATAQKPRPVIDAISHFYLHDYGTINRAVYTLSNQATKTVHNVRKKVQTFLNAASVDEIVFTKGTTESINLVASSLGGFVGRGDEILITEMEHHANIVPWQWLSKKTGAKLCIVPVLDDGSLDIEAFRSLLSKKTKVVAMAHVANTTGLINPVKQLVQEAHAFGAIVLVDGAQAVSHQCVDVQDLDADFYVFSGHKMYGPTGIGVLYGKRDLLESFPPYQGGGDMIDAVTWEETTYRPAPYRFEAGTPMIAEIVGLGAAIDYLNGIGFDAIASWERELLEKAEKTLKEVPGLSFLGTAPEKTSILLFHFSNLHPLDIGSLLDTRGIAIRTGHLCAQPFLRRFGLSSCCRISFGIYNTPEEIDHFAASLEETCQLLKG